MICDNPRAPLFDLAWGFALDSAQMSERMYDAETLEVSGP
jgi:hypothetical protein